MTPERPRARRCAFVVRIELTDSGSSVRITANATNLSLFGCQVEKQQTLPMGSKVQVSIPYRGENLPLGDE